MAIRVAAVLVLACLSGCANYKVVSDFASQTTKMTTTVDKEFTQLDTLCVQERTLVLVVSGNPEDSPDAACDRHKQARGRFAKLTVDVLNGYAKTLTDLVDDTALDVSPDIEALDGKVKALKTGDGRKVFDPGQVEALATITNLIVSVATRWKRDEAIKQMVAVSPQLVTVGNLLKSFFVAPGAPGASVYDEKVAIAGDRATTVTAGLKNLSEKEPLRSTELRREQHRIDAMLARRTGRASDAVPVQIVAAIDAWQGAVERFQTDALKPNPQELVKQLKVLRSAVAAARDAIDTQ